MTGVLVVCSHRLGAFRACLVTSATNCFCCQVPCKFNGGVVVNVDRFRTSMGGWVRLLFKNVNGSPLSGVELTAVSGLNYSGFLKAEACQLVGQQ